MAIIKSFTSLEQSLKLANILQHESADMKWYFWKSEIDAPKTPTFGYSKTAAESYNKDTEVIYLPCWSLAALLNYLKSKNKFPEIGELSDGRFKLTTYIWDGENSIQVSIGDNIVDACYELILKAHESNLL